VERHVSDKGYCNQCRRYRDITIRKTIQNIPAVLILNASVLQSPEGKQLWATPNWLPQEIGIIVERGQFFCYEGEDLKLHIQRNVYPIVVYELIGVVADIASAENQKPHLVSLVNGKSPIADSVALLMPQSEPLFARGSSRE
jgi:PAB-dependent poly(A)-specific ribonuclease subunit 2